MPAPGVAARRFGGRRGTRWRVPAQHHRRRTWHIARDGLLEVACPAAATKLSVRNHVDANLLLHVQHAQDLAIFDFAQLFERQVALLVCRPRLLELVRAQEAANLVGTVEVR